MAHRGRRVAAASTAALLALLVVGCGEAEPSPEPQIGGESTSAAPTGTPSSDAESEAFDEQGHEVHRGRIKADDAQEKAVAEAWFAFWDVHSAAYYNAEVDAEALGEVARGEALSDTVGYVKYLRKNGLHTEGDSKIGLSRIEVQGDVAGVQACVQNKSVDVDADGQPAEEFRPYIRMTGVLSKADGAWLVDSWKVMGEKRCRA